MKGYGRVKFSFRLRILLAGFGKEIKIGLLLKRSNDGTRLSLNTIAVICVCGLFLKF
jgi:hypothetical protein